MSPLGSAPRKDDALLVLAPGPARAQAQQVLASAGLRVRCADEPYAAVASFLDAPTHLVVASLRGLRRRDLAFIQTLSSHGPDTRLLFIVPASRRRSGAQALAAGGDAILVEPYHPEELAGLAEALLRRQRRAPTEAAGIEAAIAALAGEVAHAINNPLQVLGLAASAPDMPASRRAQLDDGVDRMRAVTEWLSAYGNLRKPRRRRTDLSVLLERALEEGERAGWIKARVEGLGEPAPAEVDAEQIEIALRASLALLGGTSPERPTPVVGRATRRGRRADLALVAPEVPLATLDAPAAAGLLLTEDVSRVPLPGLALPRAVARGHAGRLRLEAAQPAGVLLQLRLAAG